MYTDFVHVTRAASGGWVVVGLGGIRSLYFSAQTDAVAEACRQAPPSQDAIGVRLQDAQGRWVTHDHGIAA